ncbi:hypothetical protein [Candidatus Nitrosotenuis uzonensis]|uniref:Uncharacterized protein n=1 Tax=Candidatus Nitrosotenuis uzonensis TaxID=1407055 RepID=V6AVG9_9ARCH|nr:hypothetical protein [Candidatus Nitrosotenuis uzonensis]CDI06592.1 hypothetical protein NITUZ_60119 [Candidatus Nitrosotenuis uzonensis]
MENHEAVLCNPQEIPNLEGMLFVRIADILNRMLKAPLILFGLLLTVVLPANSFGSTLRTVDFTVYPDGTTHVSQEVLSSPQDAEIVVELFGITIENFVAQDQDGLLLSYEIIGDTAKIDTFGATSIFVGYDSYDLVTKNGRIWTFKVDSPIDYTLTLPQNTVVVGMTSIPNSVLTVGDQPRLSLANGPNEVDYFFGVTGRGTIIGNLISGVEEMVGRLESQGIATFEIKTKLDAAKKAFEERKYDQAEKLANEAKVLAEAAEGSSKGNSTTNNPLTYFSNNIVGIATSIAAIGGAITTITLIAKRTKSVLKKTNHVERNVEEAEQDVDDMATGQEMREDDKQLVEFITQNGGQAYERDLRKKFLMPRTTMWRAVKRLERQGIIEIEKKDFQNLVKLKKKEEGL